ncbi:MAG: hypothetical protein R3C44_12060 [Chloroflexota bacterium]
MPILAICTADMGLVGGGTGLDEEPTAAVLKKVHKGAAIGCWSTLCRCTSSCKRLYQRTSSMENVAAELDRLDTIAEPDFRVKAYKVDQWCSGGLPLLFVYQAAAFPRLPFYDNRFKTSFARCRPRWQRLSVRN